MFASGNCTELGMVILDGKYVDYLFHCCDSCVEISWYHSSFGLQLSRYTILHRRLAGRINPSESLIDAKWLNILRLVDIPWDLGILFDSVSSFLF